MGKARSDRQRRLRALTSFIEGHYRRGGNTSTNWNEHPHSVVTLPKLNLPPHVEEDLPSKKT